ncbi:hypothetical protein DLM76_05065 [Leptospira yasudae]|nr:hypothetical protein DLM76_05065 [Leptospira yasudae]
MIESENGLFVKIRATPAERSVERDEPDFCRTGLSLQSAKRHKNFFKTKNASKKNGASQYFRSIPVAKYIRKI